MEGSTAIGVFCTAIKPILQNTISVINNDFLFKEIHSYQLSVCIQITSNVEKKVSENLM